MVKVIMLPRNFLRAGLQGLCDWSMTSTAGGTPVVKSTAHLGRVEHRRQFDV